MWSFLPFSSSSSSLTSSSSSSVMYRSRSSCASRKSMEMFCRYICLYLIFFVDWNIGFEEDILVEPQAEPVWFMENHSLNLTCIVKHAVGRPVWRKDEVEVDKKFVSEQAHADGTVVLQFYRQEAGVDDAGIYRCDGGQTDVVRRVDVFAVTSRDMNLTLGFATSISCEEEPLYERKIIRWLKGKTPVHEIPDLEGRLNLSGANKTLTILSSKTSDAGLYTCIMEFNPGTPMEQVFTEQVGILGKPYMARNPLTAHLIHVTNTSVTLECPAVGYPAPEVFWLRNDEVIQSSAHYELDSVNDVPSTKLIIRDRDAKNDGTFICTAENNIGKTTMAFTIPEENNEGCKIHASPLWFILLSCVIVWKTGTSHFTYL